MTLSFNKLFKAKKIEIPAEVFDQIEVPNATKYAENEHHKMYLDVEELGGFSYLKTAVVGPTKVNIKRLGCSITFVFKNEELTLMSDNTVVESNEIQNTGIHFTPIDFELEENEAKKITTEKVLDLKFTFKKDTLCFKPL